MQTVHPLVDMYEAYWPIALLIYYIVLFIVAFAWRSLLVYRPSGGSAFRDLPGPHRFSNGEVIFTPN